MPLLRYSCCLLLAVTCGVAWADSTQEIAGSIEATLDGRRVVLVSLKNDYQITINGDVANVKLTQTFSNPHNKPLNARYLFPLNRQAAVHAMTMRVGNEVIRAEIQEMEDRILEQMEKMEDSQELV